MTQLDSQAHAAYLAKLNAQARMDQRDLEAMADTQKFRRVNPSEYGQAFHAPSALNYKFDGDAMPSPEQINDAFKSGARSLMSPVYSMSGITGHHDGFTAVQYVKEKLGPGAVKDLAKVLGFTEFAAPDVLAPSEPIPANETPEQTQARERRAIIAQSKLDEEAKALALRITRRFRLVWLLLALVFLGIWSLGILWYLAAGVALYLTAPAIITIAAAAYGAFLAFPSNE